MEPIRGHTGLYVGREPDDETPLWASTTAVREPLERVERSWRGIVMDTYTLEKLTGWTPELSPPPDSPLYRWRVLAGDVMPPWRWRPWLIAGQQHRKTLGEVKCPFESARGFGALALARSRCRPRPPTIPITPSR